MIYLGIYIDVDFTPKANKFLGIYEAETEEEAKRKMAESVTDKDFFIYDDVDPEDEDVWEEKFDEEKYEQHLKNLSTHIQMTPINGDPIKIF